MSAVWHREIGLITALSDVMIFKGFEYSTAGFVGMSTI